MSYAVPLVKGKTVNGVSVFAQLYYRDRAISGMVGYDLLVPVWWGLSQTRGPLKGVIAYSTSVGDLIVHLSETEKHSHDGVTAFGVFYNDSISVGSRWRALLSDISWMSRRSS